MTTRKISQAIENLRVTHVAPIASNAREAMRSQLRAAKNVLKSRALDPIRTAAGKLGAAALKHPKGAACAAGAARLHAGLTRRGQAIRYRTAQARLSLIERWEAFAARSRAACRARAAAALGYLGDKASHPERTASEIADTASRLYYAARRRVRSLNRIDATVAGLFAIAMLGPFAAPNLYDDATIALTRHNPLVERASVTAERGLALPTPNTPTLWNGVEVAQAQRDIAPEWVLSSGVDLGPLSPAEALSRPARVEEVHAAPLWSPALAALRVEDRLEDYTPLATASIPNRGGVTLEEFEASEAEFAAAKLAESKAKIIKVKTPMPARDVAALELGAFDTGPTMTAPTAAPIGLADSGVAAGDYATASVSANSPSSAWPTVETPGDLSESVAEALNLNGGSFRDLPLKSARVPSMRPVAIGAERTPRITVVLTAVGLNEAASHTAIRNLPSSIAMAVAPVAKDPQTWVDAARMSGRVALLEIPMEPVTYPRVNPGPLTLLAEQSAEENVARLALALSKTPDVDGVASYLGGRFSSMRSAVGPVIDELKKRDLFLLETDPTPLSHLLRTAAEQDLRAASSFVSLDKSGRSKDLSEGFARLEEVARVKGHAIGVAVAMPSTVHALREWVAKLESRGFRLSALPL